MTRDFENTVLTSEYSNMDSSSFFNSRLFVFNNLNGKNIAFKVLEMQSKSTFVNSSELNVNKKMDEGVFEQICDAIFMLIPEVPRLKQLFLSWSLLNSEERSQLDAKVSMWYNLSRRQLYKPLREALIRWENVQDTQGAPGCEPGMVSFSCDPQLEEELVNVICSLEMMFAKNKDNKDETTETSNNRYAKMFDEVLSSERNSPRSVASPRDRTPHSVHSCGYITDSKQSDDDLSGYMTN